MSGSASKREAEEKMDDKEKKRRKRKLCGGKKGRETENGDEAKGKRQKASTLNPFSFCKIQKSTQELEEQVFLTPELPEGSETVGE